MAERDIRSLRLDAGTLKRIERLIERHHAHNYVPGFAVGEPPVMSQAQVLRLAVSEGLTVMEEKLAKAEERKRKARGR